MDRVDWGGERRQRSQPENGSGRSGIGGAARGFLAILFAALLTACGQADNTKPETPVFVLWDGCAQVLQLPGDAPEGPPSYACALDPEAPQLTVWVDAGAPPRLRVDGAARELSWEARAGGQWATLALSPEAREVEIAASEQQLWTQLRLLPEVNTPELTRAEALADSGRAKKRAGDVEGARADYTLARALYEQASEAQGEALMAYRLVQLLVQRDGDSAEIEPLLAALDGAPPGLYRLSYYELDAKAVYARRSRRLSEARTLYREAIALAERASDAADLDWSRSGFDAVRDYAGDIDETLRRRGQRMCDFGNAAGFSRARALWNDYAWSLILAGESGGFVTVPKLCPAAKTDAAAIYQELLGAAEADPESSASVLLNLRINRALAAMQQRDWATVEALLALLPPQVEPVEYQLWVLHLRGQLALQRGQLQEAEGLYRSMAEEGARQGMLLEQLEGEYWRGQTAYRQGDTARAERIWAAARTLMSDVRTRVPLELGESAPATMFARIYGDSVRMHLSAGDPSGALALARELRSGLLRELTTRVTVGQLPEELRDGVQTSLEQIRELQTALARLSEDQALAARSEFERISRERAALQAQIMQHLGEISQLALAGGGAYAAPAPGELWVLVLPAGGAWVAFAFSDDGGVEVVELPAGLAELGPEEMSRALLTPLAGRIRAAEGVVLLPMGPLRGVNLHALPFEGTPLFLAKPVSYALDLPAVTPLAGGRTLLVADPSSNLKLSSEEGRAVQALLGVSDEDLLLQGEATRENLLRALAGVGTLLYSGHAGFDAEEVWFSRIPLADDGALSIADVLALSQPPRVVVLSACKGAMSQTGAAESIGIAQAFLIAGSSEVVASTMTISDELGRDFGVAYARALAGGLEGAQAWHAAAVEAALRHPPEEVANFRRIVR